MKWKIYVFQRIQNMRHSPGLNLRFNNFICYQSHVISYATASLSNTEFIWIFILDETILIMKEIKV